MIGSTDVSLPKSKKPVFPDECVVCGAESPKNKVKVGTNSIGWWTVLTWFHGSRFSVRIPACKSCAIRLQLRRWGALAVFMILSVLVLFVIAPLISPHVAGPMRRWVLMIGLLLCLSPFFVWEFLFPPAFDMTAYSKTVDYEFKNEDYALKFETLNEEEPEIDVMPSPNREPDEDEFPNIIT